MRNGPWRRGRARSNADFGWLDRRIGRRIGSFAAIAAILVVPGVVLAPVLAQQLPQGGSVAAGSASIGTPNNNTLTINQSSQQAIINWNSFSVGVNNTVIFNQPNSSAATLNRVTGDTPSTIAGTIRAPGTVLLVNPNGVAITSTGIVNTGSFAASSLDIADGDFLSGRYRFTGKGASAPVTNAGRINTADGGFAALLGGRVANDGIITARLGKVALGSGELITLDLSGDGFLQVAVPSNRLGSLYDDAGRPLVSNSGKIRAAGGNVQLKASTAAGLLQDAVNVSGSIRTRTVSQSGGKIYLGGGPGGRVTVSGTLAANGKRGKAGSVAIEGAAVEISGKVSANGASGGSVAVTSADLLNVAGAIEAVGTAGTGGSVTLAGPQTVNTGSIDASGMIGGTVSIAAYDYLNAGSVKLIGSAGAGGVFTATAIGNYVETTAGSVTAGGTTVGGTISISANRIFSSGTQSATASAGVGGRITLEADSIALIAASLDASGATGGGSIRIGGDFQGGGTLRHATTVDISPDTTLRADARDAGNGGTIVLWSDDTTNFYGKGSARGGVVFGDGGLIEVSGKLNDVMGGDVSLAAPNGKAGSLLLDPNNIIIDDATGIMPQYQLVDPNAAAGNAFGNELIALSNGNVVVAAPLTDVAGKADAGAVYLFNGVTGALISQISGAAANDKAGTNASRNSLFALTGNGNFVISTSGWSNNGAAANAGALTWGSGTAGVSGVISSANSLVGSTANDRVGLAVTALSNGNYVVASSNWNNGAATGAGAVTFGNGATGVSGVVSAANSLVGTLKNENIGGGASLPVTEVGGGNYVVISPFWGTTTTATTALGAFTWGNGTTGQPVGAITSANSLVGSTAGDRVGVAGIVVLTNGNYVISSPFWSGNKGAVTWGPSGSALTGVLSSSNSFVGAKADDYIGSNYNLLGTTQASPTAFTRTIVALSNGNYAFGSPYFDNGTTANAGAITWGNGSTGSSGVVSSSNSVVGTKANDNIGVLLTALTGNGKYVAANFNYAGAASKTGAVTLYGGTSATTGNFSATGALVGSSANDQVGYGGVVALSNGNYVVASPLWKNGGNAQAGAVTWVNGADGKLTGAAVAGSISATNSLVGSHANDWVGSALASNTATALVANNPYILPLSNGNYVIASPYWDNGSTSNAGAVTWANGATGAAVGAISASNSLVGSRTDDRIGMLASFINNTIPFQGFGITALANGNYVVASSLWNNGSILRVGAVTWGNGASGTVGTVGTGNSLVGSKAGDLVGFGGASIQNANYSATSATSVAYYGVIPLSNGNYLVRSSFWANGTATAAGAVTFLTGGAATATAVSASNSLVGSHSNDMMSSDGVVLNTNGSFAIMSSAWTNGSNANSGVVTFGDMVNGVPTGVPNAQSSIIANQANAYFGNSVATRTDAMANGAFVIGAWGMGLGGQAYIGLTDYNSLTYARAQTQDITITAASLNKLLTAGTNITLQASNDITVKSDIFAINLASDPSAGSLTLDAGRSILVNANIMIDGSITLRANRPLSAGVVDSQRDPGVAVITMANGTNINSSRSAISIRLEDGAGKTNADAGAITLAFVGTDTGGGRVEVINSGLGGAADVVIGPGGGVNTYTVGLGGLNGDPTTAAIVIASLNGDFINNSGYANVVRAFNNNRFVIYTGKTTDTVLGTLPAYTVANGITYPTTAGVPSGNAVVYRVGNKILTVIADSQSKTYGDANPTFTYTIDSAGLQNGDILAAAVSGTASVTSTATSSSSVGSYAIIASAGTLTSGLGYSFKFVDGALTVTAKTLTPTFAGTVTKTYDGTASASLASSAFSLAGVVGGDAVSIAATSGAYNSKNAGTGKTVAVTGLTLTGAAAANYVLSTTSLSSAVGQIDKAVLAASLIGSVVKTYDGLTSATVAGSNISLSGIVAGEAVTATATGATYNNKNAGSGKAVTATGVTLGGADAGNYNVNASANGAVGTVNMLQLAASVATATKVYDATTAVANASGNVTPTNIIGGDSVTVAAAASYSDANVGASKTINYTFSLTGTDSGNYLAPASLAKTGNAITARTVTVSLSGGVSKVYDGDATATLSGGNYIVSGFIAGDAVALNNPAAGSYNNKNVGTGKSVSVSGLVLSGAASGNYTLASTSASASIGTVTAKPLTVALAGTAVTKTYDGTTDATLAAANFTLTGKVTGDTVTVSNTTGSYDTANAGNGKTVTVAGIALAGADAGNYSLQTPSASAAVGTIDKATLTAALTGTVSKVFDNTTDATLSGSNYTLTGVVGHDAVALNNPTSGTYDNVNVGTGKTVSVTGLVLTGAAANNYTLAANAISGAVGEITPAQLTVTVLLTGSVSKPYDGTTIATLTNANYLLSGVASGDTVTVNNPATGTYDNANVGTGKTVTVTGIAITGPNTANYLLASSTASGAVGAITPLTVTASFNGAVSKIYDGTTSASLTNANVTLSGVLIGETVTLVNASGSYDTKDAGTGKTVSFTGLSLSGAAAGNYVLAAPSLSGAVGTVTAKTVTASLTGSVSKTYDRAVDASLDAVNYSLSGTVAGDTVSLNNPTAGTYDTKDVGTGKTVSVNGLALTGADKDNYTLASSAAAGAVGIVTAKALTATLTGSVAKTYDGTTAATLDAANYNISGVVLGDTVSVSTTSGSFDSKTVGTGKTVSVTGMLLAGADAGNYALAATTDSQAIGAITARNLTVALGGTVSKTYDGNSDAALTGANFSVNDAVFAADAVGGTVALSTPSAGSYAGKNAGTGVTVTASGLSLTGADAGNYSLTATSATAAIGTIDAKTLTAGLTGAFIKTYDGTTTATVTATDFSLTGKVGAEDVAIANTAGVYDSRNAGAAKTVTVNGLTLAGADAGNYVLGATTVSNTNGTINTKALTVALAGTLSKVYDGNNATQALDPGNYTVTGAITGDSVALNNPTSGTYNDKTAGTGKLVTVAGLALTGADKDNYTVAGTVTAAGDITPKTVTVTFSGTYGKVYDGTTGVTVDPANLTLNGRVTGDTLDLGTPASASFDNKNVGTGKTVSVLGLSLAGADAGNYELKSTAVSAQTGSITPLAVTIAVGGTVTKTYDGTTTAALDGSNYAVTNAVFTADYKAGTVGITNSSANYADKNVGTAKNVTVNTISLIGADAANYTLNAPTTLTAALGTINPAPITVMADSFTKSPNAADPAFTYGIFSGQLFGSDAFTGALTRASGETSGVYAIMQGTVTAGANYDMTFVPGILTIGAGSDAPSPSINLGNSAPTLSNLQSSRVTQLYGVDLLTGVQVNNFAVDNIFQFEPR